MKESTVCLEKLNNEEKLELLKLLEFKEKYKADNRIKFVEWDKYPEQTEVINKVVERAINHKGPKIYVIFGGNQSGKSEAGAAAITRVCEEKKKARCLCATVENKLSINVQQRKLDEWLSKSQIKEGDYNPSRGWKNNIIQGKNGYNVLFKTYAQGYESFQGDEFDLIWLDEEPPWDVFQECLMRTVKRNGALLFTFTSLQGFTRLVNRLWESNDPEVWTTLLDLYMNPYIAKESKDLIANTIDPDEVASRIHGKPHMKEGLIYKDFGQIHKIDRFDYASLISHQADRWIYFESIDPHERTPHHWARFLYDRSNDVLYVVEELKAPKESMLIQDFARLIKRQYPSYKGIILYPEFTQIDTSSMKPEVAHVHKTEDQEDIHTIRMEFFKAGVNTILVPKDNAMGINAVKGRLKVVRNAEGEIKRQPKLFVFNDLPGINWEFMRYSWDSYSSSATSERKEMLNRPLKKDDHYMDLIKYACLKLEKEIGQSYTDVGYQPRYGDAGY